MPEEMSAPKLPIRVLIVEDEGDDVELELRALKRAGYAVEAEVVDLPADLERKLRESHFDLVLSDHNLVTWTGSEALQILRRSGKDIPLIIVTGTLGDERAVEYLKEGASDYVIKEHLDRLPLVIARALNEKAQREENARLQKAN